MGQDAEIYNASLTPGGGVKYSGIITPQQCGFGLNISINEGGGTEDLEVTLTLQSENCEGGNVGWTDEPEGDDQFTNSTGSAVKAPANFKDTKKRRYRVKINPTGGTDGVVIIENAQ
jgi:hypothetical protein